MKFEKLLKTFKKWILVNGFLLLIVASGFLIYANSLQNSFVLDDASQITANPNIQSISNIPKLFLGSTFGYGAGLSGVYYKPLMTSTFAAIYHFFGVNTVPFHLLQLLFHIANGILVFLILKRFFGKNMSLFLALVFLVHPLQSEAVVYVSALQEPLFFFFGALAILGISGDLTVVRYLVYALLISLSLLSKETGLLFLLMAPILRYLFFEQGKKLWARREFLTTSAITFSILAIYSLVRHFTVGVPVALDKPYPIMRISLLSRILGIPAEVFYYIRNLFFPRDFAVAQHWVVTKITFSTFWLPLAFDLLVLGLIVVLGWRLLKKKSKRFRIYLLFLIWLILGIGLHLNILPLDVTTADRWFYFPMVGALGLLGLIIQEFSIRKVLSVIGILIIIGLSIRTYVRNRDWKDGLTLALHDIQYSHDSFPLENNLAYELINAGRWNEAEVHAKRSIELGPWWWLNWNNLGVIYRHRSVGDPLYIDKSVEAFIKATKNTDTFYLPYENLAELLLFYKSPKDASDFIVEASKKITPNARLWFLLAIAQYQLGNKESAINALYQARLTTMEDQTINAFYQALINNNAVQFTKPSY